MISYSAIVEAEARRLLHERMQRFPWHAGRSAEERRELIEDDIDRYWHVLVPEASRIVFERTFGEIAEAA